MSKMKCTPKKLDKKLFGGAFFMKYTFEKKLNIVSRVKAGCPIRQLAKENNLHENKILDWVRLYDRYGVDILRKRSKIKPTSDFKEQVVREIIGKRITFVPCIDKVPYKPYST